MYPLRSGVWPVFIINLQKQKMKHTGDTNQKMLSLCLLARLCLWNMCVCTWLNNLMFMLCSQLLDFAQLWTSYLLTLPVLPVDFFSFDIERKNFHTGSRFGGAGPTVRGTAR